MILRIADVCALLGITRMQLHKLRKAGAFPEPRQIAPGSIGWTMEDYEEWIASRPRIDEVVVGEAAE